MAFGTAGTDVIALPVASFEDDAKEQLQQHTEPEGQLRAQNIPEGITLYRRNDTRTDTHNCLEHDGARGKFDRIRLLGQERQLALIMVAMKGRS